MHSNSKSFQPTTKVPVAEEGEQECRRKQSDSQKEL